VLEAKRVLCCDPYVPDTSLVSLERVLGESDMLFVGTPHKVYRGLNIPPDKHVVDVWGCLKSEPTGS
jgi:UDP-N-acetyl-D-mannosaminuronic acid dehydrogenase